MNMENKLEVVKCLFTENTSCEDKLFCECCPVWYDWAVYCSEAAAKMYFPEKYKNKKEEKEDSLSF